MLTGQRCVVGSERADAQHPPGRLFFGRLVQADGDDCWFFAMLPTVAGREEAAVELAETAAAGSDREARIDSQHTSRSSSRAVRAPKRNRD